MLILQNVLAWLVPQHAFWTLSQSSYCKCSPSSLSLLPSPKFCGVTRCYGTSNPSKYLVMCQVYCEIEISSGNTYNISTSSSTWQSANKSPQFLMRWCSYHRYKFLDRSFEYIASYKFLDNSTLNRYKCNFAYWDQNWTQYSRWRCANFIYVCTHTVTF